MNFFRALWAWYVARKTWQKVVIAVFVISVLLSPFGDNTSTEETTPEATPTLSTSPYESPEVEPEPEESPSATVSSSPIPLSPVEFRASALGDLADMRKDVADAKQRISEGGIARLLGNALELSFNVGQLQSITTSEAITDEWIEKLGELEVAVDKFTEGLGDDSVSKSRANLDGVLNAISRLETFVKSVK